MAVVRLPLPLQARHCDLDGEVGGFCSVIFRVGSEVGTINAFEFRGIRRDVADGVFLGVEGGKEEGEGEKDEFHDFGFSFGIPRLAVDPLSSRIVTCGV